MTETYFTSDLHLFHDRIIELCKRPYANSAEMNEAIIDKHNSIVNKNDIVYDLGDFSFSKNATENERIFDRLNGQKHLIFGNHDPYEVRNLPWVSRNQYVEKKFNKRTFILFHYPILEHNKMFHGSIHFHGHVHSTKTKPLNSPNLLSIDVGWDYWGRPMALEELLDHVPRTSTIEPSII